MHNLLPLNKDVDMLRPTVILSILCHLHGGWPVHNKYGVQAASE